MICCAGELMWDWRAVDGPLNSSTRFERVAGGAAANTALELARLQLPAAVIGTVSDDVLGRAFAAELAAAGVDVTALEHRRGRMGVVFMDGDDFVSYRPRIERWPKRLRWPRSWRGDLPAAAVLPLAALSADTPQRAAQLDLARRSHERGAVVCVDVNARPRAWRNARGIGRPARRLLALADVVKASSEDLAVLGVDDDPERARSALGIRGALVLTRAAGTTVALGSWGRVASRPPRVAARRSIGAGDAFCAAMLARLSTERPTDRAAWRDLLRSANAHAASFVSQRQ